MRVDLNLNNRDAERVDMDELVGPPINNGPNDIEDLVLLDLDNANDALPLLPEEPVNPNGLAQ